MTDYRLYVIVRTTLQSMNPGKAQAHSGHAACHFMNRVVMNKKHSLHKQGLEWASQADGFGTQINLKATSDAQIHSALEAVAFSPEYIFTGSYVWDPTYPYWVDKEVYNLLPTSLHTLPAIEGENDMMCFRNDWTAGWFFGTKEDLQPILKDFKLHP